MAGAKPYTLRNIIQNPLARMLPLRRNQFQVYRMGERVPPAGSEFAGHGPIWEGVSFVLASRSSLQARVNLQRDYILMAVTASSSSNVNGGFRAQLYDMKKKLRLADRGVQFSTSAGAAPAPFFLREPYRFKEPDSQLLVIVQNFETVQNTIQIVLYGQALRFNDPSPHAVEFPGGPVSSLGMRR